MKNKLLWFVSLLPMLVTAIVLQFLEERIPTHYDAYGNIDGWGSKYTNLTLPVIIIVLTLFWLCFIRYYRKVSQNAKDEKDRKAALSNGKVIYVVAVGMAIMFGIQQYFYLYSAILESKNHLTTSAIDYLLVTNVTMGIFIIVIGAAITKTKNNSMVGMRTSWSTKSDELWERSNRYASKILIVAGLVIMLESFLIGGVLSTLLMVAIILIATVVSVVYSYRIYKKWEKEKHE